MTNTTHPEDLDRSQLRDIQSQRLRELLVAVFKGNAFWQRKYADAGIDPRDVKSVDDLSQLPFSTKAEIVADHRDHQPYGTNLTYPLRDYARMHQTSGTTGTSLRWLDTPASWTWFLECWEQIYRIAGVTAEDRLAFPFSFGPFIGFWAAFDGAVRLGNLSLAGGGMSSTARLRLIEDNAATVVCCTPTYALRLADVAAQEGFDLANGPVKRLIVAGEPGGGIPATRKRIESAWGARLIDHWGMTEIGSLAVECEANPGGLLMLETECIAEVIDPATGEPADSGELVITNLGRTGSPLIRYRTGDRVEIDTGECPCGRQLLRLNGGILGRTDDMVTIRGNNVFPSSLEAILREFPDIVEYRIEVHEDRAMQQLTIQIEPTPDTWQNEASRDELVDKVFRTIKDRMNFHAEVVAVEPESLPRFELKGRRFVRTT